MTTQKTLEPKYNEGDIVLYKGKNVIKIKLTKPRWYCGEWYYGCMDVETGGIYRMLVTEKEITKISE